ncbi:MAG: GCN5 family acetyltransferase [Clostridia bacterium BRH_c25]|nr:MAG: GCN5 family acetyltransferase [Clostridia bacterium BRH_c25]
MLVELRELSIEDGKEIFDMLKEIGPGENGFMNSAYGVSLDEFPDYLKENEDYSKGINLPPEYVPRTIYWLYIDSKPVGIGKLRHCLNNFLRKHGGHIGYCIRPTARGKGYGTIILYELLRKAKDKAVDEALIVCDEANIQSRKVIEGNSGVLEAINEGECKYWIKL